MGEPGLLDRMHDALRSRHYSRRTETVYCLWAERFVRFHEGRHPCEMGEGEINAFLTYLAVRRNVSATTQNQALCALLFLYREVIGRDLGTISGVVRARKKRRLPVVLTRDEVRAVLSHLSGVIQSPGQQFSLIRNDGLFLARYPVAPPGAQANLLGVQTTPHASSGNLVNILHRHLPCLRHASKEVTVAVLNDRL